MASITSMALATIIVATLLFAEATTGWNFLPALRPSIHKMSGSSTLRRSSRFLRTSNYFSSTGSHDIPSEHPQKISTSRCFATQQSCTEVINEPDETKHTKIKKKIPAKKSPTKKSKQRSNIDEKALKVEVERTQSFEPAWWGNVLVNATHPHIALAAIKTTNNSKNDKCYPPIHTLILGTHPSITSLHQSQYYGHPLNAFWYIAGDCLGFRRSLAVSEKTGKPYAYFHEHLKFGEENILDYADQLGRLVENGFALWDIVGECKREGSLDQSIEDEEPNPIRDFCEGSLDLGGLKNIGKSVKRIVVANGTTGGAYFVKHFSEWFMDGKILAGEDELSQRVFKSIMNKAKKANPDGFENDAIKVICVPSVSPAAASLSYLQKREAWETYCYTPGLTDVESWKKNQILHHINNTAKRRAKGDFDILATSPKKTKSATKSTRQRSPSPSPSKVSNIPQILSRDLAKLSPHNEWIDLKIPPHELRPSTTLTTGQCFNWMVVKHDEFGKCVDGNEILSQQSAWGTHDAKEWVGPLKNRVYSIRETPTTTEFRLLHGPNDGAKEHLEQYFRLETELAPLYDDWSRADARLAKIASCIPGVRILRQDPVECMFSFICSSNNNIPRITKMLSSFREKYGIYLMDIPTRINGDDGDDESPCIGSMSLFSFPTLSSLASANEDELREMGLGYRARYIVDTRDLLLKRGGEDHLMKLRSMQDSQAVQDELVKFSGIGRKVADCVALFSLDQDDAIPVDVHVQHIASRDYDPTVFDGAKSITPTIYKRVGDLFRDRFQTYAGWAHSLLFVAELPSFRAVLPPDLLNEMDEWREYEKQKKAEAKKS